MIKTIMVARRKPGMTREEFNKYWLNVHGPLAARLMPGVRRYVQNHLIPVPGMEYEGDGVVETWYDDIESWKQGLAAIEKNRELMADAANFCDVGGKGKGLGWIVQEHVIKG